MNHIETAQALLESAGLRCRKTFRHGPLAWLAGLVPDDYLARVDGNIAWADEAPRAQIRQQQLSSFLLEC